MILAASLRPNKEKGYEDLAARAKKLGFRGVFLSRMPDCPAEELPKIKKIFDAKKLAITEVGAYTNLIHPDAARRRANVEFVRASIAAADKLGCHCVASISGSRDLDVFYAAHPDNWSKESWKLTLKSIGTILEACEGTRVFFAIEPLISTNLGTVRSLKKLFREMRSEKLRIQFDPVNLVSPENYHDTTSLLNECFNELGEHIISAHAKDVIWEKDKFTIHISEVAPGKGLLDYETFLLGMDRLGAHAIQIEHLKEDSEIEEAGRFIKKVARRVGVTL